MSDARFREIERRWQADPADVNLTQRLIADSLRVGKAIDLTMLTPEVIKSYPSIEYPDKTLHIPLQSVRIFGRSLQDVMHDIQTFGILQPGLGLGYLHQYIYQNYPSLRRMDEWDRQRALAQTIQVAIPDVNLDGERNYSIVGLYWIPSGARIRSGSLATALELNVPERQQIAAWEFNSQGPFLLVIYRTEFDTEVDNELLEKTETFVVPRYYSVYFALDSNVDWYPKNNDEWGPLHISGYVYEDGPPRYLGLVFNHGGAIYEIFGDMYQQQEDYETTIDEINAEEEEVDDYRNRIAETIDQTYISIHEERGSASVTLWDKFTEQEIASWWDNDVFGLIEDGFFKGAFDDHSGGEFHQSVYDYARSLRLLPWQQTHETGHSDQP